MEIVEINGLNEPVTPVPVESLPKGTQEMIRGVEDADDEHPFASLRNMLVEACPCGCGLQTAVCAAQSQRVREANSALPF